MNEERVLPGFRFRALRGEVKGTQYKLVTVPNGNIHGSPTRAKHTFQQPVTKKCIVGKKEGS